MDAGEVNPKSEYFDEKKTVIQPTWGLMCRLMLRRANKEPTLEEQKRYQATKLGRSDGETLLAELLPFPKPRSSAWPPEYNCRYSTRQHYIDCMLPKRIEILRSLLEEVPREIIICYGKEHWSQYKKLFGERAIWKDSKPYKTATFAGSRVVFSPHFTWRGLRAYKEQDRLIALALDREANRVVDS